VQLFLLFRPTFPPHFWSEISCRLFFRSVRAILRAQAFSFSAPHVVRPSRTSPNQQLPLIVIRSVRPHYLLRSPSGRVRRPRSNGAPPRLSPLFTARSSSLTLSIRSPAAAPRKGFPQRQAVFPLSSLTVPTPFPRLYLSRSATDFPSLENHRTRPLCDAFADDRVRTG